MATTVSNLQIAYGSVGAQAQLSILKDVSNAILSTAQLAGNAYSQNEQLGASLQALSAKELVRSGQYRDLADAQGAAADRAQQLLGFSQKLAIISPFNVAQIGDAEKLLLSYNFLSASGDKAAITATRVTRALVDFTAGTGQSAATVPQLAKVFGQISASGRLLGGDVNQLAAAGLNAKDIISQSMGISIQAFSDLQTRGLVPANVAIKALVESLESDFGGAAARQAGTLTGVLSSLGDIGTLSLRDFATPTIDLIKPKLNALATTLQDPAIEQAIIAKGQQFAIFTGGMISGVETVLPYLEKLNAGAVPIATGVAGYAALDGVLNLKDAVQKYSTAWSQMDKQTKDLAIDQSLSIGLVALAWTGVGLAYQYYQNQLQAGANQMFDGSQADQLAKSASDAFRRAQQGIFEEDAPQAIKDRTEQGIIAQQQRLTQLRADFVAATASDAKIVSEKDALRFIDPGGYQAAVDTSHRNLELRRKMYEDEATKYNAAVQTYIEAQRNAGGSTSTTSAFVLDDSQTKLYTEMVKARVDFGNGEQDRARDYNAKLLSIDQERTTKLLDAQHTYASKVADIDRSASTARLDEQRSYAQKLVDLARERQQALADGARQAATEGAAALGTLTGSDISYLSENEKRIAAHNEKRRLLERQGAYCKIPEEQAAYDLSNRQAAEAYVQQERAQQQSLGRQLINYASAQALLFGVAQSSLDRFTNAIRAQYGLQESASEQAFGKMRGVVDEWAKSGGQSTDGYIERLQGLQNEATTTQQRIEQLTKARTDALADRYGRGEIGRDDYLNQLRALPASVNREVGLSNSTDLSPVIQKQREFDQQAVQAKLAHSQRLAQIDAQQGQQRADAARQYGASVAQTNNEWYIKQRTDAKAAYEKAEQDAAASYVNQGKAQRDSLAAQGKDFHAYVDQHLAESARLSIALDTDAQRRLSLIERNRAKGYLTDEQYQQQLAQLVKNAQQPQAPPPTTSAPRGAGQLGLTPVGYSPTARGGASVTVNVMLPGGGYTPQQAQQIATVVKREVMHELNKQVDNVIAAPPLTKNY